MLYAKPLGGSRYNDHNLVRSLSGVFGKVRSALDPLGSFERGDTKKRITSVAMATA